MHISRFTRVINTCLRQPHLVRSFAIQHRARRFVPTFDPYSYSRGRWLDRDEQRQKARRREFNFDALLDVAVKCSVGAREVVACEKREGGFNRVFVIEFDNGAKVVAKVPMQYAGPTALTTMSEVATLRYVKDKTSVPVPQVLAWSSKSESGSVGTEYIIMEHMSGVALKDNWSQMTELQQIQFIESIGILVKELCALNFTAYGSLYLNTAAEKPSEAHAIDDEYCIGPHCGRQFWGYNDDLATQVATPLGCQGPWQALSTLFADLTSISEVTIQQRRSSSSPSSSSQEEKVVVEDHLRLLETSRKMLEVVGNTTTFQEEFCSPALLHPDLNARNIFVDPDDPTKILGIIDWQSAAIEPAFVHAVDPPDFASEPVLDKTLDADALGDDESSHEIQTHAQRCKRTWGVMASICPKLGKTSTFNPTLCRYLAGVISGCSDDATSLRTLLTNTSHEWSELDVPEDIQCPYQPTPSETQSLNIQLDHQESTQRLRAYLSRLLRCETDGWIEEEKWNENLISLYREQYAGFVSACIASREEDESEADARKNAEKLWPFDLR